MHFEKKNRFFSLKKNVNDESLPSMLIRIDFSHFRLCSTSTSTSTTTSSTITIQKDYEKRKSGQTLQQQHVMGITSLSRNQFQFVCIKIIFQFSVFQFL